MAAFCTNCGSALPDGSSFCSGCGTPVGATVPQPIGVASPSAAPPPQGTSAVKIILIVLGVFIGIGLLFGSAILFGVWRFSRSVKVDPRSPDRFSISTPMGNMSVGSQKEVSEAELGVPLYPNAKREEGNVQISTPDGSMNTYVFKTSDSPAQVIEFYRGKLGSQTSFVETPDGGMITSAKDEKEGYMITVGRDGSGASITIIRGRTEKPVK